MNQKLLNYMTSACANRLQKELEDTLYNLRPKMVMHMAWAASADHGSNKDYQYAKKMLQDYNSRIQYLKGRLAEAEIINPVKQAKIAHGRILFGARVQLVVDGTDHHTIRLLGVDEHDEARGVISCTSQLGRALLARQAGDHVTLDTPYGETSVRVLKVSYPPLQSVATED